MFRSVFLSATLLFGMAATSGSAITLATGIASDNGQRGVMFDVEVASQDLWLRSVDLDFYNGTFPVEFYYREGGFVGSEGNPAAWTLHDRDPAFVSGGARTLTTWDTADLFLNADTRYGLYFTSANQQPEFGINYADGSGSVGDLVVSDANLSIFEGIGISYPFGNTFETRIVSGALTYDVANVGVSVVPLPGALSMLLAGLAGLGLYGASRGRRTA